MGTPNTASHCPSCGRYIGPYRARNETCPHCGTRLAGRTAIHTVKIAAILLATVGLAILWFAATRAQAPLIQVGQVGATMNMAYVRIEGQCTRSPTYDPESEYISFWIEDPTGEIRISAYRSETQQIITERRVPALGDLIQVAGTLRVREDSVSLTINNPGQLEITRTAPVDRQIGTIAPEDQYHRVRVRGQVRETFEPYPGLTLITIRDETGAIPIALSEDLVALGSVSPTPSFPIGQSVEVVATVSLYRDTPQLVPASLTDILRLDQPVSVGTEKRIREVTATDLGRWAVVRGKVIGRDPFSSGVKITLDDTTGTVTVLLWQSVHDSLPAPARLDLGAEVLVQGEIAQYQGQLELIPELAADVQLLSTAPPPTEVPVATPTSSPTPTPTPTPTEMVLPPDTPGPEPTPTQADTPAQAETPAQTNTPTPTATPVPRETPTPTLEAAPIGAITVGYIGEDVTVEGKVVDAASFSAGFRFTLDDGSDQIVLLMWHNIYDDCWDAPKINLGARVRATGTIAQYEGELQIQPGFGGDVKALDPAPAGAAPREIGSLSGEDEGQRVMVEGEITRVEGFSSAVQVFVRDDTGEVMVFIWRNVLDRITDNTGLGTVGSRVRVVGTVEVYRSTLEVVPTLPYDVVVLEIPQ